MFFNKLYFHHVGLTIFMLSGKRKRSDWQDLEEESNCKKAKPDRSNSLYPLGYANTFKLILQGSILGQIIGEVNLLALIASYYGVTPLTMSKPRQSLVLLDDPEQLINHAGITDMKLSKDEIFLQVWGPGFASCKLMIFGIDTCRWHRQFYLPCHGVSPLPKFSLVNSNCAIFWAGSSGSDTQATLLSLHSTSEHYWNAKTDSFHVLKHCNHFASSPFQGDELFMVHSANAAIYTCHVPSGVLRQKSVRLDAYITGLVLDPVNKVLATKSDRFHFVDSDTMQCIAVCEPPPTIKTYYCNILLLHGDQLLVAVPAGNGCLLYLLSGENFQFVTTTSCWWQSNKRHAELVTAFHYGSNRLFVVKDHDIAVME